MLPKLSLPSFVRAQIVSLTAEVAEVKEMSHQFTVSNTKEVALVLCKLIFTKKKLIPHQHR